jgi:molybdate transport system substrate-binding protein
MTIDRRIGRRSMLAGMSVAAFVPRAALAARAPLVLAAASLQESMTAAASAWAAKGRAKPVCSFAASSALARQIAAGAVADLFVSADEPWMDDIEKRGLIAPGTRAPFLGNRLVVVRPKGARGDVRAPLAKLLGGGPLALADPDAVPAGRYAKASLQKLGAWDVVAGRVVRGESVRAALAFVERGAAPFGIVYATDAQASSGVEVVRVLPDASHPPIRYPLARLKASTSPDAEPFRRFLLGGEGRAIFRRFGFSTL